jgi:tripartite-type tricarboxylate transporter receptor subunit TctC
MKKLLAVLLLVFALTTHARETVTIIYGWSPSDLAANFHRTLANEATKQQNKYTFIFDTKPGAGAAIAAQHVAKTPNTILATSSAFWIRPQFFPNESHRVEDFRELMPQCDAPLGVFAKRYSNWKDVPTDKPLTVAVSGLGITTHLVATEVAKKYPNMTVIPFKSTTESIISVLAGTTDFAIAFMGDGDQYVSSKEEQNKLYNLGTTGSTPDGKVPTLVSEGFPKILSQMNAPAHLVVSTAMPESKFNEIRAILVKAGRAESVRQAFAADHCQPLNQMEDDRIQPWFNKQHAVWKNITSGITLK